MTIRTFVTTGYAHRTILCCEFGEIPEPMDIFPTLETFYTAYPLDRREDEYDDPVRVTLTYEISVSDFSQEALDRILADLTVEDSADGAIAALTED